MVRSSIKAWIQGCLMPDFVLRPLNSTSVDLAITFMARANRVKEIVQPVIVTFFLVNATWMLRTQVRLLT